MTDAESEIRQAEAMQANQEEVPLNRTLSWVVSCSDSYSKWNMLE